LKNLRFTLVTHSCEDILWGTDMKFKFIAFCSLLVAAGCSVSYPVVAVSEKTGDRYFGTAVATTGTSTIQVSNASGVNCSGTYVAPIVFDATSGAAMGGKITCSDGRTGNWVASGTAVGGQGAGKFGNETVKLYYGQFAAMQQIH
jgi:hypothetical protein